MEEEEGEKVKNDWLQIIDEEEEKHEEVKAKVEEKNVPPKGRLSVKSKCVFIVIQRKF